ncbi:prolipoprotein diacylglyceryl transferase [Candidatus Anaplasma sp. TIGMIC]|uniref:prolipoprotein diacylglyceryl transferase n=1 Tax=Candidatus Anaplasma sp. TIGMIC TaxID=3020713 RepID=UPI00232C4BE2|nr:prolipoprotein diacylglyceryl transferase [Candidatus Anaplasma sp. TIGMIC]MDB1135687.1 prolipoprotein diacylglyceryl transferase [Candidatus Anaplasma sp. TIGMIC]
MSICLNAKLVIEWLRDVDPVAFNFLIFQVRWYALAYVVGVLFSYFYIGHVGKYLDLRKESLESVTSAGVAGIIIGGRLGYVLLYNPEFYLNHPAEILQIWHGGMSFHGAFLGALLLIALSCKKSGTPIPALLDLCACTIPVGVFLGRIANLVNRELYGKITNVCWGVIFPNSNSLLPRHPSQVYEAILEGFIPFVLINTLFHFTNLKKQPGKLACLFCICYGIARCIAELFREPDAYLETIVTRFGITMGQILSAVMVVISVLLFVMLSRKYKRKSQHVQASD